MNKKLLSLTSTKVNKFQHIYKMIRKPHGCTLTVDTSVINQNGKMRMHADGFTFFPMEELEYANKILAI